MDEVAGPSVLPQAKCPGCDFRQLQHHVLIVTDDGGYRTAKIRMEVPGFYFHLVF